MMVSIWLQEISGYGLPYIPDNLTDKKEDGSDCMGRSSFLCRSYFESRRPRMAARHVWHRNVINGRIQHRKQVPVICMGPASS